MKAALTHSIPFIISSTNQVDFILKKMELRKDKYLANESCTIQLMIQQISVEDQLKAGALVTSNLKPVIQTVIVYNYYGEEKVSEHDFNEWLKANTQPAKESTLKKLE